MVPRTSMTTRAQNGAARGFPRAAPDSHQSRRSRSPSCPFLLLEGRDGGGDFGQVDGIGQRVQVANELEAAFRGVLPLDEAAVPTDLVGGGEQVAALSADEEVRDTVRALELAQNLMQQMPSPPHLQLLALALTADGDFGQSDKAVEQLEFMLPPWGVEGVDLEQLRKDIEDLEEERFPASPWPREDPVLQPPPVQAGGPMREYPAALPY